MNSQRHRRTRNVARTSVFRSAFRSAPRRGRTLAALVVGAAVAVGMGAPLASASATAPASTSSYIVRTNAGAAAGMAAKVAVAGATVTHSYSKVLTGFSALMTADQAAALAADPQVASVTPDGVMTTNTIQSNPTWGLDRIDQRTTAGDGAYSYDTTGQGVTVFVVDSGVRFSHSEFGGRVSSGYDFIDNDPDASDCAGHGTHVSGTVGGTTFGVAKAVSYVSVRVFDCGGSGAWSGFIAAMDWVVAHKPAGPSVVNFSGGGYIYELADEAVERTVAAGIPVVVSAGNSYGDACEASPARTPNAITVGATDSADVRSDFSNYGTCVDLFAPGYDVLSSTSDSDTSSGYKSGTSMAAPHVTGIVARYLQGHPTSTPAQTATAVLAAATPNVVIDPQGSPNRLGYVAPATSSLPAAPTSFTFTKNDASRTATINWQPPASTGGSPITGYKVARTGTDNAGNGPWSATVPATARTQTFTNLKAGNSYTLTVQAITAAGTGAAASGAVTIAGLPGVPTTFKATKNVAARTATISWKPPTSTGGSPITGYKVARTGTDNAGNGPWSATVAATARTQTFTNLKAGASYTLTVRAITAAGTGSAASAVVVIASPPGAPTSFKITKNVAARTATISWKPPTSTGGSPITGYKVARTGTDNAGNGPWSATVAATARTQTFTNLKAGASYTLTVQAITAAGTGTAATGTVAIK